MPITPAAMLDRALRGERGALEQQRNAVILGAEGVVDADHEAGDHAGYGAGRCRARFHHTPRTRAANRPEAATENAQLTKIRMLCGRVIAV